MRVVDLLKSRDITAAWYHWSLGCVASAGLGYHGRETAQPTPTGAMPQSVLIRHLPDIAAGAWDEICTSVAVEPPDGVRQLAPTAWDADADDSPVALRLSKRLMQLPVSRFQTPAKAEELVGLCMSFVSA